MLNNITRLLGHLNLMFLLYITNACVTHLSTFLIEIFLIQPKKYKIWQRHPIGIARTIFFLVITRLVGAKNEFSYLHHHF